MASRISIEKLFRRISDRSKLLAKVFYNTSKAFSTNDGTNMAASISFYILLSFIPLLLLSISILGFFAGDSPAHFDQIMAKIRIVLPFIDEGMARALQKTVSGKGALGVGGILALLWSVNQIFASSERVLNRIFQIQKGRGFIKARLVSLGLALALGISLVLSVGVGMLTNVLENVLIGSLPIRIGMILNYPLVALWLPLVLLTASFTVLTVILPHGKVYARYAVLGGAIFATLFEFAKYFFTYYIMKVSNISLIYGSFGSIIIIILWVFYLSILFIFSAEFVSVVQFWGEEERLQISLAELEASIPLAN